MLPIGAATETVSVQANPLQVDTQPAAATGLITGTQVRELALQSRNYEELVALMPGVTSDLGGDFLYAGVSAPGGATNETAFSLNGSFGTGNNWTVDGADNVDRGGNFTLLNYPSVDAIDEFKVLRGNYNAEYGRSSGGQINVITRSGKSSFHGGVYEFFRNDVLDANTWENKHFQSPALDRTPLRYNDFGGTIGGPIFIPGHYNVDKSKTFSSSQRRCAAWWNRAPRQVSRPTRMSAVRRALITLPFQCALRHWRRMPVAIRTARQERRRPAFRRTW